VNPVQIVAVVLLGLSFLFLVGGYAFLMLFSDLGGNEHESTAPTEEER
jgi:hypothetical protein